MELVDRNRMQRSSGAPSFLSGASSPPGIQPEANTRRVLRDGDRLMARLPFGRRSSCSAACSGAACLPSSSAFLRAAWAARWPRNRPARRRAARRRSSSRRRSGRSWSSRA